MCIRDSDRLGQPLQRAELDFVVDIVGAGVVGFVWQQVAAVGQFVAGVTSVVVDGVLLFAKGGTEVKGNVLGVQPLGRAALGDAIPAVATDKVEVRRSRNVGDQDAGFRIHSVVLYKK